MEQGTAHSAGGYGPPGGGGYGGPPGAPPGGGGYGPPGGGGYGGPPGGGGYGGPPGGGGFGPPGGGAPPGGGGYGAPPGGFGGGAPPPGGFGTPPPGGFGPPNQFGPPGGFGPAPGGADVNTTLPLILGIASIFVCSNILFGIIGIVFAIQANSCVAAGNIEGARSKVKTSYLVTGIGAVLTVVAWVSCVVFLGMLGAMSSV